MSYPTTFANLAAGNQPASLLDTMFNIAGQQGSIPCTASGTNAITLTPATNYYLPAAYTNGQIASFKAVATSSGSVTAQIGGLTLVKVFVPAGTQAGSGDIVNLSHYAVQYWSDLDSGNGGFLILNSQLPAIASPPQASFKNLKLITTSDTTLTPTADSIVLQNAGGGTVRLTSVAPAVTSTASVGSANGIISAVANSTWYSFWFIYNPNAALSSTNPGGWLDTSATSPTLPSGYTYFARYGWFRTDASAHLHRILQYGRRVQYVVSASTTLLLPNIANGTAGTYSRTAPSYANVSVATVVPSTASEIIVALDNIYNNATSAGMQVAPNTNYSGQGSTNPPPFAMDVASSTYQACFSGSMVLESTNISWSSGNTGGSVACFGWVDNLT